MIGRLKPAMMDVFDGRCAILEPLMRECGAWVRESKHQQHPDCDRRTCGNTKTVMLDVETNGQHRRREDEDELRHQQQHNVHSMRSWWKKLWKMSRSFPRSISEHSAIV